MTTSSSAEITFNTGANEVYVVERTAKPLSSHTQTQTQLTGTANQGLKSLAGTSSTLGSNATADPMLNNTALTYDNNWHLTTSRATATSTTTRTTATRWTRSRRTRSRAPGTVDVYLDNVFQATVNLKADGARSRPDLPRPARQGGARAAEGEVPRPRPGPGGSLPERCTRRGPFAGGARTTATQVLDPETGKRVAKLKGQELLVWADDKRLIAWDIAPGGGEFDNRLVLITIGSDKVVSLSGVRTPKDYSPGRWEPIFAKR